MSALQQTDHHPHSTRLSFLRSAAIPSPRAPAARRAARPKGAMASTATKRSGGIACAACGRKSEQPPSCSRCKLAYYCDSDCQRSHWDQHKSECRPVDDERSDDASTSSASSSAASAASPVPSQQQRPSAKRVYASLSSSRPGPVNNERTLSREAVNRHMALLDFQNDADVAADAGLSSQEAEELFQRHRVAEAEAAAAGHPSASAAAELSGEALLSEWRARFPDASDAEAEMLLMREEQRRLQMHAQMSGDGQDEAEMEGEEEEKSSQQPEGQEDDEGEEEEDDSEEQ